MENKPFGRKKLLTKMFAKVILNKKCKQTSKSPGCEGSGISAYPQICSYDPDVETSTFLTDTVPSPLSP